MLIVPVEKGLDWSRAPVITAVLIVLNCLIYLIWQTSDDNKLEQAIDFYQQSVLPEIEYPIYISHLHQHHENELASMLEAKWQADDKQTVYAYLITDRSFAAFLNKTTIDFWGEDVFTDWQRARQNLEQQVQSISYIRLGLIPAEDRELPYFTYQFLHGDFWHLLGNMVFLAVVGMGVEAAIGSFYFFNRLLGVWHSGRCFL